LQGCKVLI